MGRNSLGIAGLIIGIIAFPALIVATIISLRLDIPVVGTVIPGSGLAIILSAIGIGTDESKGMAIAGLILGIISAILGILSAMITTIIWFR